MFADSIKKKKFKPFKKMKNFFRGGSKKRFKPEDIGGKAHSIGALHSKHETEDDDDDEGGYVVYNRPCKFNCRGIFYTLCQIFI